MKESDDLVTIRALRADVALQIARFIRARGLSQAAAARLLDVPQPTLSKIVNGRVNELSIELLIRIAVRAGLPLVLQTGTVPAEAGAYVSGPVPVPGAGARSRLADRTRDDLLVAARALTPEQRLNAHLEHSELVTGLRRAGARAR